MSKHGGFDNDSFLGYWICLPADLLKSFVSLLYFMFMMYLLGK